ncbi:MAG TPA: ABC transporter permease [Herpetosiphonaceae bacterium]
MATTAQPVAEQPELVGPIRRPRSLWSDARRRLLSSALGRIGLGICGFLVAVAVFVPIFFPYDPSIDRDTRNKLKPPSWTLSAAERAELKYPVQVVENGKKVTKQETGWGLMQRPFGTDELGRDLFVRVLHGAPISLTVGMVAVLLSVLAGSLLGLLSGFIGGLFDTVAVWFMDILLAFPSILLAIALTAISNNPKSFAANLYAQIDSVPVLSSVIDAPLFNAMLAVAIVEIPIFARIARAAVLSVRSQEYIVAAESFGAKPRRILFRHILPNSLTPILVQMTLSIATAITSVAALGFLGLGAQPPRPEWGTMLAASRNYVGTGQWWYTLFPGIAIMLTVLGFNLLGDGLRDALDPRVRA